MPTSAKTGACYTSLIGATVLSKVRTISGLALAPKNIDFRIIMVGFQMASENFGIKRLFFKLAGRAFSKQYCLRGPSVKKLPCGQF
jgi:hypothetical protein